MKGLQGPIRSPASPAPGGSAGLVLRVGALVEHPQRRRPAARRRRRARERRRRGELGACGGGGAPGRRAGVGDDQNSTYITTPMSVNNSLSKPRPRADCDYNCKHIDTYKYKHSVKV